MKTKIATDRSQSDRLLRCGVSADTADMIGIEPEYGYECEPWSSMQGQDTRGYFPAWSLSALLWLLPSSITDEYDTYFQLQLTAYPNEEDCYKWCLSYYSLEGEISLFYNEAPDPIEACVRMIEHLTNNGYKLNEQ